MKKGEEERKEKGRREEGRWDVKDNKDGVSENSK